ncbi:MAG: helix-turn-helix transcriptional regulator, partial [Turicibacter sp.]
VEHAKGEYMFYIKNSVFDRYLTYIESIAPDYDVDHLLKKSDLSVLEITNCDIFIDYAKIAILFFHSAQELQRPLFAFQYAQYLNEENKMITIMDKTLPFLKTLDMAYHFICEYINNHTNAFSFNRVIVNGRVYFCWELLLGHVASNDASNFQMNAFFSYRTFQQIYKIVRENFSCGEDVIIHMPSEFSYLRKKFLEVLDGDASCNINNIDFEYNKYAISFPEKYNDIAFKVDADEMFSIIETMSIVNSMKCETSFYKKVLVAIKNNLDKNKQCDLLSISKNFCMHPRTLQLKLSHENCKFADVLNQARKDISVGMLLDDSIPIYTIAEKLGFSDSAIFSRAFRLWFNVSPREWRKLHKK